MLNIKTDYIIKGDYLHGKFCKENPLSKRNFTLPFNLVNGRLKGGLMLIYKWVYPYQMFPRVRLEKIM